ncbi:MAG: PadR family transcriptional regulator, partial [Candidatus Thorarchaeota archaeon]
KSKVTPIQTMIMIQLLKEPQFGYEILRNLRESFEGIWTPKTGTIYPALQTLEKKGLILKEMKDDRKYYKLTKTGRELMNEIGEYVVDYILFNMRFIASTVKRIPSDFAQEIFLGVHASGIEEILPEQPIVESIVALPNQEAAVEMLEFRKQVLKKKLALVEKELKRMRGGGKKNV